MYMHTYVHILHTRVHVRVCIFLSIYMSPGIQCTLYISSRATTSDALPLTSAIALTREPRGTTHTHATHVHAIYICIIRARGRCNVTCIYICIYMFVENSMYSRETVSVSAIGAHTRRTRSSLGSDPPDIRTQTRPEHN